MVRVERGNTVLDIEPENTEYYLSLGFDVLDDKGKVIKKAIPTSMEALRKAYIDNTAEIEKLRAEIAKLKRKPKKD